MWGAETGSSPAPSQSTLGTIYYYNRAEEDLGREQGQAVLQNLLSLQHVPKYYYNRAEEDLGGKQGQAVLQHLLSLH